MTAGPDVWSAEDCGLIDDGSRSLLAEFGGGGDGSPDEPPDGRRDPVTGFGPAPTRIVDAPVYEPYRSSVMPLRAEGYELARRIMAAVYSPEVRGGVLAGPVADTVRRMLVLQSTRLWSDGATPAGRGLAALARIIPAKGGEVKQLWAEYRRRNPRAADPIMAMRELWGSIYTWQFIRGDDARLHDLCASVLCLTTAVDFADARDDSGAGGHDPYMVAASEGLACLGGPAVTQVIRDIVVVGGLMKVKDDLTEEVSAAGAPSSGPGVTPAEFLRARWWDGAMVPHHRIMLASAGYRHVGDRLGTLTSTAACPAVGRAVDNLLRYNDIVDAVADFTNRECFNTLLVALASGAPQDVAGYDVALAEACDAVLTCPCGRSGHEESAELSMGACLWYLLVPRYLVARQLAALAHPDSPTARACALPLPAERLRATACRLPDVSDLHTPTWDPLWRPDPGRTIEENARRVVRRSVPAANLESLARDALTVRAATTLALCYRATTDHDLLHLAADWQVLFDAALATTRTPSGPPATSLRHLIGEIWRASVLGRPEDDGTAARLFVDVDQAVRSTYRLPAADGFLTRRAFFGVMTGAVELGGLNPYKRLVDGLVAGCR